MKAELTVDGALIVTGETGVETYALKKWFDNYVSGEKEMLKVETDKGIDIHTYINEKEPK